MLIHEIQIAIVVSLFNSSVTEKLLQGAVDKLTTTGLTNAQMKIVKVPGAVEIPLTAKLLASSQKYHAIICLGAIIRGETNHYDYVCQQVSQGCQQVMLEYSIPVIFGVLTTNNSQQAFDRVSEVKGHKGIEAAEAALHMVNVMQDLQPC